MLFNNKLKIICFLIVLIIIALMTYLLQKQDTKNQNTNNIESVSDLYGVNVHFTGNPIDIKLIQDSGFKIVRAEINWAKVEKKRGVYDFKNTGYDDLTNGLVKHGIRPYYILDYGNYLYEENNMSVRTEAGRNAFNKFVEESVKRYKNQGVIWEIWNEPNKKFWNPHPSYNDYSLLVKKVSKTIKENDPSGIVVAPALAGLNTDTMSWLEETFKRGVLNDIDAISVHPYRKEAPETVSSDYQSLRTLISRYSKKKIPIISGEWGYPTGNGWPELKFNQNQQSIYAVRMFLVNSLNHIPISIWYDWKNDGIDPNNGEHNFGLREANASTPKLSSIAIKTLTKSLSGYHFDKRIDIGNKSDYVLIFKNKEGKAKVVCWTTNLPHEIELSNNIYTDITSMYGEHIVTLNKDNIKVIISSSPIYISIN
ncbi:cellulase family glycosylhydrolase [Niallia sp. 03190]|uniref:cellulase family glycosylhydrolase n=1 Tax=Niallia sp. 03190 TaxID=3458061 RepID=UPI004044BB14